MVKKRIRDPEELPDAPVHSAGEDNENDSGSDVSFGFLWGVLWSFLLEGWFGGMDRWGYENLGLVISIAFCGFLWIFYLYFSSSVLQTICR